jgi:hypothetical protein
MVFALFDFYSFNYDILKLGQCCGPNRGFYADPAGPSYVVADPDLVGSVIVGLAGSGIK